MCYSCSITKHLQPNQFLLQRNEIEIKSPLKLTTKNISKKELLDLAKPAENKLLFGILKPLGIRIKWKMLIFNAFANGKQTGFKYWIQTNLGEPYSIYDSTLALRSKNEMKSYLINKGYYDATVDLQVKKKNKKASLKYIIRPKTLYVLNDINEIAYNADMQSLLNQNSAVSFLKKSDAYSSLNFKNERERIEILMRNNGYFDFSQQYVLCKLDSSAGKLKKNFFDNLFSENKRPVNVKLIVKDPENEQHKKFTINNVFVFPNFKNDTSKNKSDADTIVFNQFKFVGSKFKIKFSALVDNIYIEPHQTFSLLNQQQTNARLNALGMFSNVSIQYIETGNNQLDCYIFLTPSKKNEFGADLSASSLTEFFGFGLNVSEKSKNFFHNGDLFTINLKSALESPYENIDHKFHTLDLGAQTIFQFPKFIVPFRTHKISVNENPKTNITASYNYLERQDFYKQNQTNFSFGYDWNETKRKHHYLNPLVLSFINYNQITDSFQHFLSLNPLLQGSFKTQLIPGMNYSFTYNTLDPNAYKTITYFFKSTFDVAGNLSMLVAKNILNTQSSPVVLFGNELSQFVKVDFENRFHIDLRRNQSFVFRFLTGVGKAYGNSSVLPYIKQFYMGGPNDMRGWRARTLGPGIYQDPNLIKNPLYINETGDLRLEANAEYRFNIWWYFKGALFSDIGNMWLIKKDTERPGAEFNMNTFYKQFAVDAGAGLRFDYNYFLLRLDIGFPLINPQLSSDQKWLGNAINLSSSTWRSNNLKYNLAIGYPF